MDRARHTVEQVLGVHANVSPEAGKITAPMANAGLVTDLLIESANGRNRLVRDERAEADPG